jgi:hypothetical protein
MKKQLISALELDLARNRADYEEFLTLREIMKQFEGKKLTAMVNHKLPNGFRYGPDRYGDGYSIFGPNNQTHYVCRGEEKNNFKISHFDERNSPYSKGSPERIAKLEEILNSPEKLAEVVKLFTAVGKAFQAFEKAAKELSNSKIADSYPNPAYYRMLEVYGIPSRWVQDAKYGKYEN